MVGPTKTGMDQRTGPRGREYSTRVRPVHDLTFGATAFEHGGSGFDVALDYAILLIHGKTCAETARTEERSGKPTESTRDRYTNHTC